MISTRLRTTSVAIGLSLAALPAAAQSQLWIHQLGTSEDESTDAVATDGMGGAFVGGATAGSLGGPGSGGTDAWLAHYDGAGSQLWSRQLGTTGGESLTSATPAPSGGVYVSGLATGGLGGPVLGEGDSWLARYDSSGSQLWIRQFGTPKLDFTYASTQDGSGGVYVGGHTYGDFGGVNAGHLDAWLVRYDSSGSQLWKRQFGTNESESAYAAAPDGLGGIYLTGTTTGNLAGPNSGAVDAFLVRYDSAGNQLWIKQFGTIAADYGAAAAPDGSGGVYIGGTTTGNLGGPNLGPGDAWLARYDSAGQQLWLRQFGTNEADDATGVAAIGQGGVFVCGYTWGSLSAPNIGNADAWVARYDASGNSIWATQFGTNARDEARAVAPDESGGVHVVGKTMGSLEGSNSGKYDAWVARYDGQCGASSYCSSSTTSLPNCQASILGTGTISLADPSAFTISSGSIPGGYLGICFFGDNGTATTPFGTLGGKVCVQPPFIRSAPKPGGGTQGQCNGVYNFTLQNLINASTIVVPGAVIYAEIWARDPFNADGFLLSNGLEFTVCP